MSKPNIINVTNINGKTGVLTITTSPVAIVTNSAASDKIYKVNALYVSNINGDSDTTVDIDLYRESTPYYIAKSITVPADATIDIVSKSIYLEEGDSLRLAALNSAYLSAICSWEEIS